MAQQKGSGQKKTSLIDPIYQKFTKSVIRALGSTDFYEFFMDAISCADNQFQFSNRKAIKTVDLDWVDAIDDTLSAFQTVISSPRNVIREEELIVNVANAKKAGSDVVRHLAQHANLVEDFDEGRGNVRPSRLMQKYREDSTSLYENRLVFTTMEMAYQFVKIRHDALFAAMNDEFGAKLKLDSNMESATEQVHMEMYLHIKEIEGALETDEKNRDVFERISRIYRVLGVYMTSQFAQQMSKLNRVKGSVTKTNVLKKNPSYHKILQLFEFLHGYDQIGYTIRVVEQNPQIDETFQRDIYHNILFNYLILKGYLEDEADRQVPAAKSKKRSLKPKFIKEIIEELTEDYDLPDVEIRKVLIEELTKEQLMHEEAEERRRLVEEQAQRKKEEQERIRQAEEAEKERIRKEKEAEKERLRLEKEAEEERQRQMRMEQEAEDRRRCKLFQAELERFQTNLPVQLEAREKAAAKKAAELAAFEEMLRRQEEEERRRQEEAALAKQREAEEQERLKREAEERAERERLEKERAEQERIERLAAELRLKKEEEERLAREKEAEEQRRQQLLQEQRAREEEARRAQDLIDTAATQVYLDEVSVFLAALPQRMKERQAEMDRVNEERRRWDEERQRRRAERIPLFRKKK